MYLMVTLGRPKYYHCGKYFDSFKPRIETISRYVWIRSGEWLAIKGMEESAQTYQVGAHFQALIEGVFLAP